MAASTNDTPSGISSMFCRTMRPGMRMNSAYAPLLNSKSSQRFGWPLRQKKQVSQGAEFAGIDAHAFVHAAVYRTALAFHHACQFMAKKRGGLDHARVKALLPNLQIRAARERHFARARALRPPRGRGYPRARSSCPRGHTAPQLSCVRWLRFSFVHDHHFQCIIRRPGRQLQAFRNSLQRKPVRDQFANLATAAQKQATRILPDLPETRCSSPESLSLPRRRPPPESLTASPDRYEQTVARAPRPREG